MGDKVCTGKVGENMFKFTFANVDDKNNFFFPPMALSF